MKSKVSLLFFYLIVLSLSVFVSAGSCPNGTTNDDGSRCVDTSCLDPIGKLTITPFSDGWTRLDREARTLDVQVKMVELDSLELKGLVFEFSDGTYTEEGIIKTEKWMKGDDDFDLVSGTVKLFKFDDYADARRIAIAPIVDLYGEETTCGTLSSIDLPTFDTVECTDTDGGADYFVKGSTTGGQAYDGDDFITLDDGSPKIFTSTDSCSNSGKVYENYCSEKGAVVSEWVACPNDCKDGACIKVQEEEPQTKEENEEESQQAPKNEEEVLDEDTSLTEETESCPGKCIFEDSCVSIGYRSNDTFCDTDGKFIAQKEQEKSCENNFECESNLCINNECISGSLWAKFVRWLSRIFG